MRIALISDVHGNITALEATLRDARRRAVDLVVCLGDIAFKGPAPGECCALLLQENVVAVCGNTDLLLTQAAGVALPVIQGALPRIDPAGIPYLEWHLNRLSSADLSLMSGAPFEVCVSSEDSGVTCYHASAISCEDALLPSIPPEELLRRTGGRGESWCAVGHTHIPGIMSWGEARVLNPGAVGFSLDGDPRASYAVLNLESGTADMVRVEYSISEIVRIARDRAFCFSPTWYEDALRKGWWEPVPYDIRAITVDRY